jgi:hypothetical protein
MSVEETAAPPDPRRHRAAMVRRLAVATVVPLVFLAGPFPFALAEAVTSLTDGMGRFSLARVGFVIVMALVPLAMGVTAAELAKPHPAVGPFVFTAAFVAVWGVILYRGEGGFAFFIYLVVTVPAYLLGAVWHTRTLARRGRLLLPHRGGGDGRG